MNGLHVDVNNLVVERVVQLSDECIFGVVGVLERDQRFLMIQRSEQVRAPGMWCFPGGGIEPGETPAEAIVREFREEVGLIVEAIGELWQWCREDGGLHLRWWKVQQVGGVLAPRPSEVQSIKWMTDEQIRTHDRTMPNNVRFLDHYRSRPSG